MTTDVPFGVARTRLPEFLRRVAAGESFTITIDGDPVADLLPSAERRRQRARVSVKNLRVMPKVVISNDRLSSLRESGRK